MTSTAPRCLDRSVPDAPAAAPCTLGTDEPPRSAPLAAALRFPHPLVAGYPSLALLRLVVRGGSHVERVAGSLRSGALERESRFDHGPLSPTVAATVPVEIEPRRAGQFLLSIRLACRIDDRELVFSGRIPLRVLAPPESRIEINLGDIQCQKDCGANAALGAEFGDLSFAGLLDGLRLPSLNELLAHELSASFQPIDLAPGCPGDWATPALPDCSDSAAAAPCCVLRSCADETREIRLVTGSRLRIGRSRSRADYVGWFWPRTPAEDARTRRLSKLHVVIEARGGGFQVSDPGSVNGSRLDGRRLGAQGTRISPAGPPQHLLLADDYSLRLDFLPKEDDSAETQAAATPEVGCLRLVPTSSQPPPCEALWVLSSASFGSGDDAALRLADPSLVARHGRFLRNEHEIQLQVVAAGAEVRIDHRVIHPRETVSLQTGMQLRLGRTQWVVEYRH